MPRLEPAFLDVIRRQRLAVAMVLAVGLLAGANWILSPEQAERWLRAMLTLPVLCLAATLWKIWMVRSRLAAGVNDDGAIQRYFQEALTLAVLTFGIWQIALLGLEIWVGLGEHRADLEFERRIRGLATSAMFVIYGNALPKILTPLSILPLHLAERVTSARRFVGPVLFNLGLAMAMAFVFLPLGFAKALTVWATIGGSLTILGAIVWMNIGPARREEV